MNLLKKIVLILIEQKIIKYLFVGGCAAGVDLSIFFIFAKLLNLNYLIVSSASFIIATYVNYLLSIKFVFKKNSRFETKTEIFLIYLISSLGLSIHLIILYTFIDQLYIEKMLSKIIATASVFIWNYTSRNYFIFKEKEIVN